MIIYNTLKKESRRTKKRCATLAVKREIRRLDDIIWHQNMELRLKEQAIKKTEKEFAND